MELKIIINLDNAAFEDAPIAEAARILTNFISSKLGRVIASGGIAKLMDINGNTVGQAELVASN